VASEPSFCFSVFGGAAHLSLPANILYIPLHGLVIEVIEKILSRMYYCSFQWSRRSSFSFVR